MALATSCTDLEPRPLPSAGITRLRRYYGPLRHPARPGLSLAGLRLAVTRRHRVGFPVLRRVSSADMPSSLPRRDRWTLSLDALLSPGPWLASSGGGLPRFTAGSAPALFFSRPARRSLALRPVGSQSHLFSDPFHRRLRRFRFLRRRSDCYRLERPLAGWVSSPLKTRAFSRRTAKVELSA